MSIIKVFNKTHKRSFQSTQDSNTDSLVFVDFAHHQIHDGDTWHVEDTSANIGAETGDLLTIQFTTPASSIGLVHTIFEGFAGAAYTFDLREAQTGGGGSGSAITAYNRRRDDTGSHGMSFLKDSAVGTGGTVLFTKYFGAGVGSGQHGGLQREISEWVLLAETLYQVRVYSANAVAAYVSMDFYLNIDKH